VEKGERVGFEVTIDESFGRGSDGVAAAGAAQRLLYPPAPRLAIFLSACDMDPDGDSGVLDPGSTDTACAGNRRCETNGGARSARSTPTSRPMKRDLAVVAMT
jgi:hypothetical protein